MTRYDDPNDPRNWPESHTGKPCIEPGCSKTAGTEWSPYWCFEHNVERIKKIDTQLRKLISDMAKK
jgi:hypothetical protein